jgi:3-deoxy-7-phosphoheptulonate synthase
VEADLPRKEPDTALFLEPFARHEVNLLEIESRPIHGRPWEYQFFLDLESDRTEQLAQALAEVRDSTTEIRALGLYVAGKTLNAK